MSMKLLIYLFLTLVMTVSLGLARGGVSGWSFGLAIWAVTGGLAYLLYGEQKGHPMMLSVPFVGLLLLFWLKVAALG